MFEFAIFVIVIIVVSVITKARQQSAKRDSTPSPRMQKLIERIQAQQGGNQPIQFRGQFQAPPIQYRQPAPYQPQQPNPEAPAQRPSPKRATDARVRDLMRAGNDVAAVRLLSDELDMSIIEAQAYARSLVAPPESTKPNATTSNESVDDEEEGRYVGSAAFAESIFNLDDRDENVWASGWVDKPEPDDRSDIEELWKTVANPPRPGATPPS